MIDTGYDYYPMKHGITLEYVIYEITGIVVMPDGTQINTIPPDVFNHRVNVANRVPHANSPQLVTSWHDADTKMFGNIPYFTAYHTSPSAPEFLDNSSLINTFGSAWDGEKFTPYIGEVGSFSRSTFPPNPLMPLYPHAGQTLDVHLSVYEKGIVVSPNWRASLHVIGHFDTWGPWSDCWITVLTERDSAHVYEYVFAKGIGVVNLWHGQLANGIVTGYEYYLSRVIKGKRA